MTKLGREYQGKLPPGAITELRKSLAGYQKAARSGIRLGVKILPPGDCPAAAAQKGLYTHSMLSRSYRFPAAIDRRAVDAVIPRW
jgi:hypothetical protein